MKIFSKQEIDSSIPEHTPRCFYANELKPGSKMDACSVLSGGSVYSSSDGGFSASIFEASYSNASCDSRKSSSAFSKSSHTNKFSYKTSKQYCCRRSESTLLIEKHPKKIPLIIERFKTDKKLNSLDRCQYVLPPQTTVGQLQHVIKSKVCDGRMPVYILVNGEELPALDVTMGELAARHTDEDGFLYLAYSSEDSLG